MGGWVVCSCPLSHTRSSNKNASSTCLPTHPPTHPPTQAGNHFLALFPCEDIPVATVLKEGGKSHASSSSSTLANPPPAHNKEGSFGRRVSLRGRMLRRLQEKFLSTLFFRPVGRGGKDKEERRRRRQ